MDAPAETRGTASLARLVAVVAVLLGLLAMHGVAGAHHAAAAPTDLHATAAIASTPAAAAHPHASSRVDPELRLDAAPLVGPLVPACQDDCAGSAAVLCVAVLTGMAVALLLARRRGSPLLPTPAARQGSRPSGPPSRHARGPDPVRELCISRT